MLGMSADRESRGCLSKLSYRTKSKAIKESDRLFQIVSRPPRIKQHPYKCLFCKFWHLTKQGKIK